MSQQLNVTPDLHQLLGQPLPTTTATCGQSRSQDGNLLRCVHHQLGYRGCSGTGSTPKSNHNLTTCSLEQPYEEARAAPVLSQKLKWGEVGKLGGRGDQHDQEAHNHPCRGIHQPKSQRWLAGPSCTHLWSAGSAAPSGIHPTPTILQVSPYHICWQHMPGDFPRMAEGHWEKVLGGKEVRPPRTLPPPKARVKTQLDTATS